MESKELARVLALCVVTSMGMAACDGEVEILDDEEKLVDEGDESDEFRAGVLGAEGISESEIQVQWDPDGSSYSNFKFYRIQYRKVGNPIWGNGPKFSDVNEDVGEVGGLQCDTDYKIRVKTRYGAFNFQVGPAVTGSTHECPYTDSFSSFNFPDRRIRHQGFRGKITPIVTQLDIDDSTFWVEQGLADPECQSFRSSNFPGRYLRHRNYKIYLDPEESSSVFRQDATFCLRPGRADASMTSFESLNYPDYYIRHIGFKLYISDSTSEGAKADSTFNSVN
ncbi:MAG: AbfB domain-containing protein [Planctomycetota bacterium]